jgi:hypothetical protein
MHVYIGCHFGDKCPFGHFAPENSSNVQVVESNPHFCESSNPHFHESSNPHLHESSEGSQPSGQVLMVCIYVYKYIYLFVYIYVYIYELTGFFLMISLLHRLLSTLNLLYICI